MRSPLLILSIFVMLPSLGADAGVVASFDDYDSRFVDLVSWDGCVLPYSSDEIPRLTRQMSGESSRSFGLFSRVFQLLCNRECRGIPA